MRTVVIYNSITKPDSLYGLPSEAINYLLYCIGLYMVGSMIWEYPFIFIFPYIAVIYAIFYITTLVDPFFFAILDKKPYTKQRAKNKGNFYVC